MFFYTALSNIWGKGGRYITSSKVSKARINKWDYMKLKNFCMMKGTIHKTKISPTEWEKIFASNISEGDKYPKYTKNLYNSKLKKNKESN